MLPLLFVLAGAAPTPPLADAVSIGDCAPVLAQLTSPADDVDRLARGTCLAADGPVDEAVATLGAIGDPGLRPYARWLAARALVGAERHEEALAQLDGVTLPGPIGLEARLLRGQALVALGRSLEAREDLRALLDTEVGVAARFWLARGGEDRGERDAAIRTYQRVWASGTRGDWAARAADALGRLGAPVPDPSTEDGRALMRDRAAALSAAQDHAGAAALLDQLGGPAAPDVDGVALARARLGARDYVGAVAAFASALGPPERATGSARDLFDYALATARAGDYDTAHVVYERVIAQHPTTDLADQASFKRGYMAYDARDCPRARALFEEHVRERPRSRRGDEALWFASRCAFLEGEPAAARALLERLATGWPRSSLAPGAAYWSARADGLLGDAAAERDGLEAVLRRWPVSGWAWFAVQRLGRTFPTRPPAHPPAWPPALAGKADVRVAEQLLAAGLRPLARPHLERVRGEAVSAGRGGRLALAHALLAAGDYQGAKALAAPHCREPWQAQDADAVGVCVPRPEAGLVAAVGRRHGLDPDLPYAIMTAESNLDPTVTSAAGARGLMQVMPAEGPRMHADVLGERPYDPDRLYQGAYNAALGTAELGMKAVALGDCLDGPDLPAVIASYNGGEAAVRRWIGEGPAPEADAWAEEIGYAETRTYVRRVLGFRMAYLWAYGGAP